MQFLGIRVLLKRIKAIRFMMADKTVPKRKKALIVFGIIYLFLPIDLITADLVSDQAGQMIFCCGCLFSIICAMSWTVTGQEERQKIFEKIPWKNLCG